MFVTTANKQR